MLQERQIDYHENFQKIKREGLIRSTPGIKHQIAKNALELLKNSTPTIDGVIISFQEDNANKAINLVRTCKSEAKKAGVNAQILYAKIEGKPMIKLVIKQQ